MSIGQVLPLFTGAHIHELQVRRSPPRSSTGDLLLSFVSQSETEKCFFFSSLDLRNDRSLELECLPNVGLHFLMYPNSPKIHPKLILLNIPRVAPLKGQYSSTGTGQSGDPRRLPACY